MSKHKRRVLLYRVNIFIIVLTLQYLSDVAKQEESDSYTLSGDIFQSWILDLWSWPAWTEVSKLQLYSMP